LVDDLLGHGVLDELLDGALQWAGTELLVVALLGQEVLGLVGELQVVAQLGDALVQVAQFDVDDLVDVLPLQRVEHDDVIDAVEELRSEGLLQRLLDDAAVVSSCAVALGLGAEAHAFAVVLQVARPMLEVMMMMEFLKSMCRPRLSVILPSSSACSSRLNTSGCAFSISSSRMME
jgi:hypothetical protein